MSLLTWNHACSVNIRAMDDQHGILMDTINDLRLAFMHGGRHERVTELLDQLIEFSRMHFFSEEQLMLQTSFPGLHDHRDEHQRMLAEMLHAAHRVHNDEQLQTREMLLALHDGFLAHIEGLDRAYGPWLHDHGIS